MATIHDVARESNVSITTVSTVLNNRDRPVSAETRERVLAVAQRLNYHPNAAARALAMNRMHSLGVLFCTVEPEVVSNFYASAILQGIFREGARQRWDIHLFTTPWVSAAESAAALRARQTDGTLIIGPTLDSDAARGLEAVGLPVVVVSAPSETPGVPFVDVDNAAGGRLAAEHLVALGHRRIAHLRGELNQQSVHQRWEAFQAVLEREGITAPPEYLPPGSFLAEDAYQATLALLRLPTPPTAIFTTNDAMAFRVLEAARDLGVRVPDDLSVVGFDDYTFAAMTSPPLTTIRHPLVEIGETAARLLIDRIEGRPWEDGAHLFAPELVVRGSTAPRTQSI